jgi:alkanesulfonate monooxygenase SsuD/methylene tetrahydromethanopterin reductase-like flavin-dependent oxidoreductase (luciferase family)
MVKFDPVWLYPKPVQRPHPPILLGGESEYTLRRIAEFCDGWFPRITKDFDAKIAQERLSRAAEAVRRDPKTLTTTAFRAPADAVILERFAAAGMERALLEVPDLSRDEILRTLDTLAPLARMSH